MTSRKENEMKIIETIKNAGFVEHQDNTHIHFHRDGKSVKVAKYKKVVQTCAWCQGTGIRNQFGHVDDGVCYTCKGKGKSTVKMANAEHEIEIAYMEYRTHGKLIHSPLRDSEDLPKLMELFRQAEEAGFTSIFDINK